MHKRKDNYKITIYFLLAIIVIQAIFLIASCQRRTRKLPAQKEKEIAQPEIIQGRIAVVLDDWGYNLRNIKALEEIKEPLTLAILPNLNYSSEIAQKAAELKKEVILHLPLEPYREEHYHLEKNTIFTAMPKAEVIKILRADFNSVPGLKGASNHMGSKATEDESLMRIIFTELKKRKLYFLDSFTSKTICKGLAYSLGLPYAQRHVFLDNNNDYDRILAQFETLARLAKRQGFAVGIGHARTRTLEALVKVIPDFKKRGFKFVFVSELVK